MIGSDCIPCNRSPDDQQRPEYVDLPREDALFREAWLARTVQQCQLMIDENAPPEGCETMARAVQDLGRTGSPSMAQRLAFPRPSSRQERNRQQRGAI